MRTTTASGPRVARTRSSASVPDSSAETRRVGPELRERDPRERLRSVGEDAHRDAAGRERPERRARRRVAAEVGGSVILREALEQRPPVPAAARVELRRRAAAIVGQ